MRTRLIQVGHLAIVIVTLASLTVAPIAAPIVASSDIGSSVGRVTGADGYSSQESGRAARPFGAAGNNHAQVAEAYGKLPLSFEPNRGQTDPQVKFLSRGNGYTLFLTSTEAVLSLRRSEKKSTGVGIRDSMSPGSETSSVKTATLRMKIIGANPEARIEGEDSLRGKSNYLIGDNRANWHTDIPTYASVRYENAYPGIDVVYYGHQRQLEYDFIVSPGADPDRIAVAFEGSSKVTLDDHGDLVLKTAAGDVVQHAPVAYQETESGKATIEARYILKGDRRVSFEVGGFDRSKPLVIDPRLVYSTFLGGTPSTTFFPVDIGFGVAADGEGNAYIVGETKAPDFPLKNAFQSQLNLGANVDILDAFVTKLNAAGTDIVFSTFLGGSAIDRGLSIALTGDGKACVTGITSSTLRGSDFPGFPTTSNAFQRSGTLNHDSDAFVSVLTTSGDDLLYSTLFGGTNNFFTGRGGEDSGNGIAVDTSGNVYITGDTSSNDLPTKNAFQGSRKSSGDVADAFIAKFDPSESGNASLLYSSYLGGTSEDISNAIAVDTAGNAYIAGKTHSIDLQTKSPAGQSLPPLRSTFQGGDTDAFVAKIDPTNATGSNSLVYLTYFGGTGSDQANAIAVDSFQRAYITGLTLSSPATFPLLNAFDSTRAGDEAYVAKLNANGTTLFYSSFLGGAGADQGFGIAVDPAGNTYVAGTTGSPDFPQINALPQNLRGSSFLTKIEGSVSNTTTPKVLYSTTFGGLFPGASAFGLALDRDGNAYMTGQAGSEMPTTPGAFQAAFGGGSLDAFVAKFASTFADTIGLFRPSTNQFLLRNSNTAGSPDLTVAFGQAGDLPITGDWDGDGIDDVGVFRPSTGQFILRQTRKLVVCVPLPCHTVTLVSTIVFNFGQAGDLPVVGDWDGNGTDTIGVFRNGEFLLRNSNSTGAPDKDVFFGGAGDIPLAGDWDGNGDSIGLFRPSTNEIFLKHAIDDDGVQDIQFTFGAPGDRPVVGDWDGDGVDTIGLFRDGTFFLDNVFAPQVDVTIIFGASGDRPVAGDWDGTPR